MVSAIECRGLEAGYGRKTVLRGVSFHAYQSQCTGIVGPNGCGKTTLMRVLARFLRPSAGGVFFGDRPVSSYSSMEFARSVAYLPSRIEIAYPYTVGEFLAMGRYPFVGLFGAGNSVADVSVVRNVAEQFALSAYLDAKLSELSEGERQRVFLAQCVIQNPAILLLDEPTSHLDIGRQYRILDLLKHFQSSGGCSVVVILHDLNLASLYCERIVMMRRGAVVSSGTPGELLTFENIESVYESPVLVYPHPISKKPYVFGVPEHWRDVENRMA